MEENFSSFSMIPPLPENPVTAMAYIPYQTDKSMYEDDSALMRGTLFLNLYKPFCRGKTDEK